MKTTFSRIFFTYMMILLAALLTVGFSFQLLVKNYLETKAIEELLNDSKTISQVAAAHYANNEFAGREFFANLSVATKISQSDAVICDANGRIVLCSDAPLGCEHQGLSITNRQYLEAVKSRDFVQTRGIVVGLYSDERLVVSTPIRDALSGHVVGIVMVSAPTASTVSVVRKVSEIYLFVAVLVVLVALVLMTIYARKNSTPLQDMAKTATAFGHGNLKARASVPPDAAKEVQDLGLAFNNMAVSLEKSEYQRQEFVANISHELKTPMTTIGGYVDGILDGTIPEQRQEKYLRVVSDEVKRLSRLVRSMLDISRLQDQGGIPEEKKTRFDLSECAGMVLITFEQKILQKGCNVEVDMPEHSVYTFANQDYITQVIYNLLDNAVKFCPAEGTLGLRIREGGGKLYVSVSNDGETIPPEELPLVFDRFHKTDKSRTQKDGWGLGLYIVKTIVCSHGENISVTSREGK
ncbi:MAG: HAMP domain-containing protein, partial [Oscillospiraceae bacterium]|nr:HAMP domain-containing protein [Oscillospiraceae bacterium]